MHFVNNIKFYAIYRMLGVNFLAVLSSVAMLLFLIMNQNPTLEFA